MRRIFSLGAGLCLAVVPVLGADTEVKPIRVEALIDGRSRLIVQGNSVWWYHMEWTCPGRHGEGVDRPTVINEEPWMPKWPDRGGPKNEFGFCESAKYEKLDPPLPKQPLKFSVQDTQARGEVRILQQPAKVNDYTLIVEITDEAGGSADYVLDLVPEKGEEPAVTAGGAASLREGLVAEYLLDGTAGDSSGKGHEGKAIDVTPVADRFGRANAAMQFNGASSFIEVSPPPELTGKAMSVSAWVRYDTFPEADWNGAIVAQDDGRGRRAFQLSTNGNHVVWHRMMDYGWDPVSLKALKTGQWYHVAATFDGKEHTLYVDGKLQQALPGTLGVFPTEPVYIGRKGTDEKQFYFSGAIDGMRIYDRALKAEEVVALYQEKP